MRRVDLTASAFLLTLSVACSAVPAATSPAPSTSSPTVSGAVPTPTATVALTASPAPMTESPQPTASPSPRPAATVTPSPTAPPTPSPAEPSVREPIWERVADQEAFADSEMYAVASGLGGYVAVGRAIGETLDGIAWTSADGRTWTRSAHTLPNFHPRGVIWDGVQFVTFGFSDAGQGAWSSADGQSWQPASGLPVDLGEVRVASVGDELYAISGAWGDDLPAGAGIFKTWSSSDAISWQPVTSDIPPPELYELLGFTSANGMLIAWGNVFPDEEVRPLVAHSTDGGRTWQSTMFGRTHKVLDVIELQAGILAVGSGPYCCDAGGSRPVRAWTSSDAVSWTRSAFLPEAGNDMLADVAPYAGGYVALGMEYGDPISWRSDDGTVWVESSSVPDAAIDLGPDCTGGPCPATWVNDLAIGDSGLVAVGENWQEFGDDEDYVIERRSVVWIAPLPAED